MIKVCITVRNRLAITKKCIESLLKFSVYPLSIHIYDNLTNYRFNEHLEYYMNLYTDCLIDKFVINSQQSTFSCFSKAVAFNDFGFNHNQDPDKDKVQFLLLIDNDMLVKPQWDVYVNIIMQRIKDDPQFQNIHIVTQEPGGVTDKKRSIEINGIKCWFGTHGGSGFWCLRPTFFDDIGFLDLKLVQGINKKHDQNYWKKIGHKIRGNEYSLSIEKPLALHTGPLFSGSVCNELTKNGKDHDGIKFENLDKSLEEISFMDFYEKIKDEPRCINW